ncbi:hypothetical protein D3C72_2399560 [compost metagenome]
MDRHAHETQRQIGPDFVEERIFIGAAGRAVAEDSDLMARCRVRLRQIAHMPEDAADGRSEAVDDAQGTLRLHRDQNSRSRM